jgi:hypothetical protein
MIRALKKLGIEESFLNIIKSIYDKPIVNIKLNEEKLKIFPLKSRTFFNKVIEILPKEIGKDKVVKVIHIDKEKVKLSLYTDVMTNRL